MTCREMILSEEFQDFLTYYVLPPGILGENIRENTFCSVRVNDRMRSVYLDRSLLPPLSFSDYQYRYITEIYGLMDTFFPEAAGRIFDPQPLVASGIAQVQRAPLGLTGKRVVIGFADTGIDYRNPVFRKPDGSTRILAIWDQTIQSGTPPEGFVYGSEYTRQQINEALKREDPYSLVPTRDEDGHGTRMSSAAAGSALNDGVDYLGAAPDADIVMVKLKQAKQFLREYYMLPEGVPAYGANDIVLAVKYLSSFAIPFRRPAVICLGLGRSFGDHVENSALSSYLSEVSFDINRVVVVAGGNEGNSAHHYAGSIMGTESEEIELRVAEGTKGFLMEIWGNFSSYFSVSVRSPGGEEIPAISSRLNQGLSYTFVYHQTQLRIDYQLNDPASGREVAVLRFEDPGPGIWTLRINQERAGTGTFHIWLPIRQFVDGSVEFLRPSPETTLTSPSYASNVLTVSTYDSSNNSFYINSGQGFGLNGKIKPELAAPGVDISVAAGMLQGRSVIGKATGSSLAAALAAGGCAQLFQWSIERGGYSDLNGIGVVNYMARGAARDAAYIYPSRMWGYGRMDMEGVFDWLAGLSR